MILYVLGLYPAPSETFVIRELEELQRQNIDVSVLRLRAGDRRPSPVPILEPSTSECVMSMIRTPFKTLRLLVEGLCRTWRNWKNAAYWVWAVPKVLWAICRIPALRVRRVHAHWATLPSLAALIIARECGLPFSFTAHAYDLFTPQSLFGVLHPAADAVITVSNYNREWIRNTWKETAAGRVRVAYCGLPEIFRKGAPGGRRHEMSQHIYTACRFVETKGVDVLIRAFAEITGAFPAASLVLFGDGPLRKNLEALARRLGVFSRVEFRGWVTEAAMLESYDSGGVFALPCREAPNGDRDGIPVSLLEAMARELPVVTTPVSGIPEVVEHGIDGWLVEAESVSETAAALRKLLSDPALCRTLGTNAGKTIDSRFLIPTTIRPLAEVLTRDAAD